MNSSQKPPSPGKPPTPPTPSTPGAKPPSPSQSKGTPQAKPATSGAGPSKPQSPGTKPPAPAKDAASKSAAPKAQVASKRATRPKEIIKPTTPNGALVEIEEIDISATFSEAEDELTVLKELVEALEKDYGPLEKLKIKNDELKAQVRELRPKFYSSFERQIVLREKIHAAKLTAITTEDLEVFDKHIEKLNKAKDAGTPAKP